MTITDQLRALGLDDARLAATLVDGKPLADVERRKARPADRMNKWERGYAWHLDDLKKRGVVKWWRFEALKFRLADRTWYTPDYTVGMADGSMVVVEVKGFRREDALVKFKVARETHPEYRWMMLGKEAGLWKVLCGDSVSELTP
jgi:hypothetical protein